MAETESHTARQTRYLMKGESNKTMQISGYRILRPLGEGGMATVYLAEQTSLGREVALKVLSPSLVTSDTTFCDRFVKEGKIIAKLHHPHIVTIHDIGIADNELYFMAMEYCSAGTLKERIKRGDAKAQALRTIREIASALGYAHQKGFVHRDIKPANILFRDDGSVVLSDFGIAKTMDDRTQLTQAGWAIGTPEYMSPEQATAGKLNGSSDLYSLGVVLFELITGKKPFVADYPLAVAFQHVNTPIPRLPSEFSPWQHILDALLAKRPEERYQDAAHLIADIDKVDRLRAVEPEPDSTRVLAGGALVMPPPTDPKPLPTTRADKRNGPLLVGAALIAAASLAWTAWKYLGPPGPANQTDSGTVDPEYAAVEPAPVPEVAERQQRVVKLLQVARAHEAIGRLRAPIGANAYEAYELILEIDPDNAEAKRALARLDAQLE